MPARPSFIVSSADVGERAHVYPQSTEAMGPVRRVGHAAGLVRIGVNVQRLPPGTRSSWPHAEENEEEFVYVIDGKVDAWIDGHVHPMVAGDLAAFPAGTGICHCFINNGDREAVLLVGGDTPKKGSRIVYPVNPSRRTDMQPSDWWEDAPRRELGPHDGMPDAQRGQKAEMERSVPAAAVTAIAPQLRTTDIRGSVDFYTSKLGFVVEFNYQDFYVGLRAGNNLIHLKRVDDKDPSIPYVERGDHLHLYLETRGVAEFAARLKADGVPLVKDVHETPWQTREIVIRDNQGHTLYLGEPL